MLDMLPSWAWALIVAEMVGHSCTQSIKIEAGKLKLSQQETKTKTAEGNQAIAEKALSDRISGKAQAVAAAVQKARLEERAETKRQQERIYALQRQNEAAHAELAAAGDRVRGAIDAAAAAGASCANLSETSAAAGGAEDGSVAKFKRAGRTLADGILQLLATDDEVIRERNLCVDLNYGDKK